MTGRRPGASCRRSRLAPLLAALSLVACGGDEAPVPPEDQRVEIVRAHDGIIFLCDDRERVPRSDLRRADRALSRLVAAHRRYPIGEFEVGESDEPVAMRQLLEEVVVITFDGPCATLAHRAKRELYRERRAATPAESGYRGPR